MSGTSLDGIDTALVDIDANGKINLVAFVTYDFPDRVRERLLDISSHTKCNIHELSSLNYYLGEIFADSAFKIAKEAGIPMDGIDLIGSHGQTLFHFPTPRQEGDYTIRSSIQIGEADVIAERTGVSVVSDFRARDMAAGGEGAPLTPYFHFQLFKDRPGEIRVIVNIGGISNITLLPATGIEHIRAFDTGPGNILIDGLIERISGGRMKMDKDGRMAAAGRVIPALLARLMDIDFIKAHPPKSTGRDLFGRECINQLLGELQQGMDKNDLIATTTAFSAKSLAYNINKFMMQNNKIQEIIIGGGGAHNTTLVSMIKKEMLPVPVIGFNEAGINGDAVEAMAFAFLARETMLGNSSNLRSVTGATQAVVLGKISPGRNWGKN